MNSFSFAWQTLPLIFNHEAICLPDFKQKHRLKMTKTSTSYTSPVTKVWVRIATDNLSHSAQNIWKWTIFWILLQYDGLICRNESNVHQAKIWLTYYLVWSDGDKFLPSTFSLRRNFSTLVGSFCSFSLAKRSKRFSCTEPTI